MNINILLFSLAFLLGIFACSPTEQSQNKQSQNKLNLSHSASSNDKSTITTDSIEIWDDFANEPFLFRTWKVPLDSVIWFLPRNVVIERGVKPSDYSENKNDTIYSLSFGYSLIQYVKGPTVSYVDYAIISEHSYLIRKDIRIGDSYEKVKSKFPDLKNRKQHFDKLYIYSGEDASNILLMEFENDKLIKIVFWPYTG